jgi:hypothetical protein
MSHEQAAKGRRWATSKRWRAAEAREALRAWEQSGQTLTAFAQTEGIDRARLARWRKRLAGSEPEVAPIVRFHPVQVVADRGKPRSGIEVLVSGGLRVSVEPGFVPEVLIEVIEALEGRAGC